jgi:hypothetical protein
VFAPCYAEYLPTTREKLETPIAKVRNLPQTPQKVAVAVLQEIAEEPYQLSDDELALLKAALEEARRGEHLTDAQSDDLLNKPWA